MFCNGLCAICSAQCYRGEIKHEVVKEDVKEKTVTSSTSAPAVIEPTDEYVVTKTIFGKLKAKKV